MISFGDNALAVVMHECDQHSAPADLRISFYLDARSITWQLQKMT